MIIAVDGTAASGKGTLAKALAKQLNLAHLDSGTLYRACGITLLLDGLTPETVTEEAAEKVAKNLNFSLTTEARIRTREVSRIASIVAAMKPVRDALLEAQRRFAKELPEGKDGAVMDGRDIGTVVLPDADFKFFVEADLEIRAERRLKELINTDPGAMLPAVMKDMAERDERDLTRKHAPLKPADDAIRIDTTDKSIDQMVEFALDAIRSQSKSDGT